MTSSPSLCPLFPATIHICRLGHENPERDDSLEVMDTYSNNDTYGRRRVYGNMNMPLNSSRVPLNPNHIASQMLQHPRPLDERPTITPVQPIRRSARATQRHPPRTRTPTPPPLWTPTPPRNFHRRGAIDGSATFSDDTRRHGMILEGPNEPLALDSEIPPTYTSSPSPLSRRVTDSAPSDPYLHHQDRASRQLELRELQRQWTVRRRTHPQHPTERTFFRPPVSEAYDLPPPYAPQDPYPLFKPEEPRPSVWARAVLYPFVPEGKMLDKAAFATDRLARCVVGGVKKGVEGVGKKAMKVPRQIESTRAKRKIRWLEGRGYVDREGVECGVYPGAWHVEET